MTRATTLYAQQAFRIALAYLDRKYPGWHEKVDPYTLRMSDPDNCIIGQLHGGAAARHDNRAYYYNHAVADAPYDVKVALSQFDHDWRDLIIARRAGGSKR